MQLTQAFIFLIRVLMGFYVTLLLLRMLLQLVRADFYNPLSQAIVKLTSPLVVPLRRVLPALGRIDSATLLLAFLVEMAMIYVVLLLQNFNMPMLDLLGWAALGVIHQTLNIFILALFVLVILSWVAPFSRSPGAVLIQQLTEPLVQPVRNALPPLGGFDFSVTFVLLFLYVIDSFIIPSIGI